MVALPGYHDAGLSNSIEVSISPGPTAGFPKDRVQVAAA